MSCVTIKERVMVFPSLFTPLIHVLMCTHLNIFFQVLDYILQSNGILSKSHHMTFLNLN